MKTYFNEMSLKIDRLKQLFEEQHELASSKGGSESNPIREQEQDPSQSKTPLVH